MWTLALQVSIIPHRFLIIYRFTFLAVWVESAVLVLYFFWSDPNPVTPIREKCTNHNANKEIITNTISGWFCHVLYDVGRGQYSVLDIGELDMAILLGHAVYHSPRLSKFIIVFFWWKHYEKWVLTPIYQCEHATSWNVWGKTLKNRGIVGIWNIY
jgi:hypothetical protein